MFDVELESATQEQRDQLAGALESEAQYQEGTQATYPEGWTPVPLDVYEGYSETVSEYPS